MSEFGIVSKPYGRKDYRCEWCGQKILRGEQHIHFVGRWEGEFQDWRMHPECYDAANKEGDLIDGFTPFDNERPDVKPIPTEPPR